MIDMLVAILTGPSFNGTGNAYGSIPCAGWTRAYSGTGKSVCIPPVSSASRRPYRIGTHSASYLSLSGYDSMSDVDTGVDPFPPSYPGLVLVSGSWIVAADERTCVVISAGGRLYPAYFGEFVPVRAEDTAAACVIGSAIGTYTSYSWIQNALAGVELGAFFLQSGDTASPGVVSAVGIARNWNNEPNGIDGSILFHAPGVMVATDRTGLTFASEVSGIMNGLNPVDGKIWYSPIYLFHRRDQNCVRGRLRGLFAPMFRADYYTPGTTFEDGADEFDIIRTGSSFLLDGFGNIADTRSTILLQLTEPEE